MLIWALWKPFHLLPTQWLEGDCQMFFSLFNSKYWGAKRLRLTNIHIFGFAVSVSQLCSWPYLVLSFQIQITKDGLIGEIWNRKSYRRNFRYLELIVLLYWDCCGVLLCCLGCYQNLLISYQPQWVEGYEAAIGCSLLFPTPNLGGLRGWVDWRDLKQKISRAEMVICCWSVLCWYYVGVWCCHYLISAAVRCCWTVTDAFQICNQLLEASWCWFVAFKSPGSFWSSSMG